VVSIVRFTAEASSETETSCRLETAESDIGPV
jgi:hypothetical protein